MLILASAFLLGVTARASDIITLPPMTIYASDGYYTIPVSIYIDAGDPRSKIIFDHSTTYGGFFDGINQTDPYILDKIARTKACQQAVADYVGSKTQVMAGELQEVHTYIDNYAAELVSMNNDVGQMVAKVYERYAPGPVAAQLSATVANAAMQAINGVQGGFIYLAHQAQNVAHAGRLLNLANWQAQANQSCADSQEFTTFVG